MPANAPKGISSFGPAMAEYTRTQFKHTRCLPMTSSGHAHSCPGSRCMLCLHSSSTHDLRTMPSIIRVFRSVLPCCQVPEVIHLLERCFHRAKLVNERAHILRTGVGTSLRAF